MPTATTTTRNDNLTQYNPSGLQNEMFGGVAGAAGQLVWPGGNFRDTPQYGGERTAFTTPAWNTYMDRSLGMQAPSFDQYTGRFTDLGNQMQSGLRDPNAISFNSQYGPGQFNVPQFQMNDPFAGYQGGGPGMQVQAPTGIGTTAADYRTAVDQVQAPQGISYDRISGLPQVQGPNLQQYQMAGPERVSAPGGLNSFQLNDPMQVKTGSVGTQSFTQPGTAQSFMSPYMQNVLDVQKDQAQRDYNQQITNIHSDAAKAGAFGGTRQAVMDATANRDLQDRMANIQATGTQQAFQQAQQQFNTEQGLGLGAQQFNQQLGLQGQQLNQQAGLTTSLANQQAALAAQGLGATTGMQAALANQQAGLATNTQNLQALLGVQGLGAQLGSTAQLANQQMAYQQQYANQQAGLQAGEFNNQQAMQAALANQSANLQAGLMATQLGFQGANAAAGYGMQAQQLNQAAQQNQFNRMLTGLGQQYAGNLQSGLQTQNLGMQAQNLGEQSRQFGAQFGLNAQQATEAARNAAAGMNLNYLQGAGAMNQAGAGLVQQGFQNDLANNAQLGTSSQTQMAYDQAKADRDYQYWQQQQQYPFQMLDWYSNLAGRMPQQGSVQSTGTGQQVQVTPGPNPWNIAAGLVAAGVGGFSGGLGGAAGKSWFG